MLIGANEGDQIAFAPFLVNHGLSITALMGFTRINPDLRSTLSAMHGWRGDKNHSCIKVFYFFLIRA